MIVIESENVNMRGIEIGTEREIVARIGTRGNGMAIAIANGKRIGI